MLNPTVLILSLCLGIIIIAFVWAMTVIARMARALAFYCAEKGVVEKATIRALIQLIRSIWRRM